MLPYVLTLLALIGVSVAAATAVNHGQRRAQRRETGAKRLLARRDRLTEIVTQLEQVPVDTAVLNFLGEERLRCALVLEREHSVPTDGDWTPAKDERGASWVRDSEPALRQAVVAARRAQSLLYELAEERRLDKDRYKAYVRELGRCEIALQVESLEGFADQDADTDRLTALRRLRYAAELLIKNAHLDRTFPRRLKSLRQQIAALQSGLAADGIDAAEDDEDQPLAALGD